MFAALLISCTCPTFEEMEVVPADDSVTESQLDVVQVALAHFSAWTGDVGVCVPEIRLQEDLPEPRNLDGVYEVTGQYEGEHRPIVIDSDAATSLWRSTFHELCHANDQLEGHSDAMTFLETAELNRLASLSALQYEREREAAGQQLDLRLGVAGKDRRPKHSLGSPGPHTSYCARPLTCVTLYPALHVRLPDCTLTA